jgi:hypothetical protein
MSHGQPPPQPRIYPAKDDDALTADEARERVYTLLDDIEAWCSSTRSAVQSGELGYAGKHLDRVARYAIRAAGIVCKLRQRAAGGK